MTQPITTIKQTPNGSGLPNDEHLITPHRPARKKKQRRAAHAHARTEENKRRAAHPPAPPTPSSFRRFPSKAGCAAPLLEAPGPSTDPLLFFPRRRRSPNPTAPPPWMATAGQPGPGQIKATAGQLRATTSDRGGRGDYTANPHPPPRPLPPLLSHPSPPPERGGRHCRPHRPRDLPVPFPNSSRIPHLRPSWIMATAGQPPSFPSSAPSHVAALPIRSRPSLSPTRPDGEP